MASTNREDYFPATPLGAAHAHGLGATSAETQSGPSRCGHLEGLSRPQDLGREQTNAFPALGSAEQMPDTFEDCSPLGRPCAEASPRGPSTDDRPDGHTPLPQLGEAILGAQDGLKGTSLAMDNQQPGECRALAHAAETVLSQRLATHFGTMQTPTIESHATGRDSSQRTPLTSIFAIRVLLNSSGTLCYANSFFIGISWMMLLCQARDPALWHLGFALLAMLTYFTPAPLDLSQEPAFLSLLTGEWTTQAFAHQQDLIEFSDYMMMRLKPGFVNGEWAPLPMLDGDNLDDTHLRAEKGLRHTSIRLSVPNTSDAPISVCHLIQTWHDVQGLCRLLREASTGLCVALDRSCNETQVKLTLHVHIPEFLSFPWFEPISKTILWVQYQVIGVAVHHGTSLKSGHYQCALRAPGTWFIYDDGQLPTKCAVLPDVFHCNAVYLWLVRQSVASTPAASTAASSGPSMTRHLGDANP